MGIGEMDHTQFLDMVDIYISYSDGSDARMARDESPSAAGCSAACGDRQTMARDDSPSAPLEVAAGSSVVRGCGAPTAL